MEKLVISIESIKTNIDILRKYAKVQLIGTIDKYGYGCGSVFLARTLISAGVTMLATSDVQTANKLLDDFPQITIILMSPSIGKEELKCIIERGATATIANVDDISRLDAAAREAGKEVKVHLMLRTYRGGCGISPSEIDRTAILLGSSANIGVDGVYSHLDPKHLANEKAVLKQKTLFDRSIMMLNDLGVSTPVKHIAESYSAMRYPDLQYNAVRTGDCVIGRIKGKNRWRLIPVGEIEAYVSGLVTIAAEENKELHSKKSHTYAAVPISCDAAIYAALAKGLVPFTKAAPYCIANKKKLRVIGTCGEGIYLIDASEKDIESGDNVRFTADPRFVSKECERRYE